jgi:hypothetical protein
MDTGTFNGALMATQMYSSPVVAVNPSHLEVRKEVMSLAVRSLEVPKEALSLVFPSHLVDPKEATSPVPNLHIPTHTIAEARASPAAPPPSL